MLYCDQHTGSNQLANKMVLLAAISFRNSNKMELEGEWVLTVHSQAGQKHDCKWMIVLCRASGCVKRKLIVNMFIIYHKSPRCVCSFTLEGCFHNRLFPHDLLKSEFYTSHTSKILWRHNTFGSQLLSRWAGYSGEMGKRNISRLHTNYYSKYCLSLDTSTKGKMKRKTTKYISKPSYTELIKKKCFLSEPIIVIQLWMNLFQFHNKTPHIKKFWCSTCTSCSELATPTSCTPA